MDNLPAQTSMPAAAAAPVVPAPPAALPAPVPQVGTMETGGPLPATAAIKKENFFSGITLSEVLVTGLVVFGLLYSIYYTRQRMLYLTYEQKSNATPAS